MITTTAVSAIVVAVFVAFRAALIPFIGTAFERVAVNVLAYLMLMPVKLVCEGIHRFLHR